MKNLSLAQKKYLLLALAMLLGWLGRQLAFKKTFQVYSQYKVLSGHDDFSGLSYPRAYNLRKMQNLENILQGYRQDSTTFRNNLLYQVAYQAQRQNVKVVQVPMQEETVHDRVMQRVTFQGSYFGLISLVDELKKVRGIGKVRGIKLKQPGPEDKHKQTVMDVYFVCLFTKD